MSKRTIRWSLIPDVVEILDMELGYDEKSKSKVFPEAGRVGDFTC